MWTSIARVKIIIIYSFSCVKLIVFFLCHLLITGAHIPHSLVNTTFVSFKFKPFHHQKRTRLENQQEVHKTVYIPPYIMNLSGPLFTRVCVVQGSESCYSKSYDARKI